MPVKNIVFDVGNVLVTWNPVNIIQNTFPELDPNLLLQQIFKTGFWLELNAGKITERQAIEIYHQQFNLSIPSLENLMHVVKESLIPLEDTLELVRQLKRAGFPLYIITDNTKEIMQYLRAKYQFWDLFIGVVVSADIGFLKPSPEIYQHLLETYQLRAEESVFFDDVPANVEGAKAVKMHSFQFSNAARCIEDLKTLNIQF
jgi:putative hydrolase of the HAD superfamily